MTVIPLGPIGWPVNLQYALNLLEGKQSEIITALNAATATATTTIADGAILSNISGAPAPAVGNGISPLFDHDLGNTNGMVATRSGGAWTASFTTGITGLGIVTTGTWHGSVIAGQYGGTGVANTGLTITLGGNLVTSGAFGTTLTVTAATNSTLPAGTHTLAGLDVAQTWTADQTLSGAALVEPYSYNTPATGNTVTMGSRERRCINNPAGALAALTVVLPPSPGDGDVAGVSTTQVITALTVNAGTGGAAVVGAPSTLAAGAAFSMLYRATGNSWYISP